MLSLATGGLITYLINEQAQQQAYPEAEAHMVLTIGISVTLAAICMISMTADWWLHR